MRNYDAGGGFLLAGLLLNGSDTNALVERVDAILLRHNKTLNGTMKNCRNDNRANTKKNNVCMHTPNVRNTRRYR